MNIIMIMGGPSFEANVSYKSAENIGRELVNAKHNVLVCDLLKEGLTKYEEVDWEKYSIEILPDKKFINSIENRHVMLENLKKISISDYDIVFNATHGTFGEDGHLLRRGPLHHRYEREEQILAELDRPFHILGSWRRAGDRQRRAEEDHRVVLARVRPRPHNRRRIVSGLFRPG